MKCIHTNTSKSENRGYTGSVSRYNENRAAHGSVCYTETCLDCGYTRDVNANGVHEELGQWGQSREMIAAQGQKLAREKLESEGYSTMIEGKKRTVKFGKNGVTYDTGATSSIAECVRACGEWQAAKSSDGRAAFAARSFYLGLRTAIFDAGLAS